MQKAVFIMPYRGGGKEGYGADHSRAGPMPRFSKEGPSTEAIAEAAWALFQKATDSLPCTRLALAAHDFVPAALTEQQGAITRFFAGPAAMQPGIALPSLPWSQSYLHVSAHPAACEDAARSFMVSRQMIMLCLAQPLLAHASSHGSKPSFKYAHDWAAGGPERPLSIASLYAVRHVCNMQSQTGIRRQISSGV